MRTVCLSTLVLTLGFMLVIQGCSEDDSVKPALKEEFTGILKFDENCNIIGGDATDFIPRPDLPSGGVIAPPTNYSLVSACPNPADGLTIVHFQTSEPDSIWFLVYDRTNSAPMDTLRAGTYFAGAHGFQWSSDGETGIFRIEMRSSSGFTSYGDVEFTQ